MHVPGTARRELEIAMAKAHGLPDLGSHTVGDATLAKKLFTSLEARGIDIAVFRAHPMDDLVAKKVNTALTSDPLMPSKSTPEIDAARGRAEQWALAGANGDPSEFANRYEYARAKFGTIIEQQSATIQMDQKPANLTGPLYKKSLAAPGLHENSLDASLARDFEAIQKLGPGTDRIELLSSDLPETVAARVQQHDRFAYQTLTAEAYHVEKHAPDLDDIVGLPLVDGVVKFAEATRITLREGAVHTARVEANGSIKVVIRRTFAKNGGKDKFIELEVIAFVQPDGKVVVASFGKAKSGDKGIK